MINLCLLIFLFVGEAVITFAGKIRGYAYFLFLNISSSVARTDNNNMVFW